MKKSHVPHIFTAHYFIGFVPKQTNVDFLVSRYKENESMMSERIVIYLNRSVSRLRLIKWFW